MKKVIRKERMKQLQETQLQRLLELAQAVSERERLMKLDRYRPLPHQKRFHKSPAQIRALIGANRCGKTKAGVVEALWYATGTHPYKQVLVPNSGWVVTVDHEVTKDVILPMILEHLDPNLIQRFNRVEMILELTNGSTIKFKSGDSEVSKFQSAERRWIWFDEEPRHDVWNECSMRAGAKYPLDIWLTMTPLNGMNWSYDEIYCAQSPGKVEIFEATLMDNKHLPAEVIKRLRDNMKGSDEESARIYGKYFQRSGLIYKAFNRELHVIDSFPIPREWPILVAVDPHPRKPSAACWAALSPEGAMYVVDELCEETEQLLSEFAARVLEKCGNRRIMRRLIDPSALQKSQQTGRSTKDELARNGLSTTLANNDVHFGWDAVRLRLAGPHGCKLFFFRNCPKTIWQVEHLVYEEYRMRKDDRDPKETQRKKDDDLADCVRYLCAAKMVYDTPWSEDLRDYEGHQYSGY